MEEETRAMKGKVKRFMCPSVKEDLRIVKVYVFHRAGCGSPAQTIWAEMEKPSYGSSGSLYL